MECGKSREREGRTETDRENDSEGRRRHDSERHKRIDRSKSSIIILEIATGLFELTNAHNLNRIS